MNRALDPYDSWLWVIRVDVYMHLIVAPPQQPQLLTSTVKRVDVGVYEMIRDSVAGEVTPGRHVFDLAANGAELASSGGFIDEYQDQLDDIA